MVDKPATITVGVIGLGRIAPRHLDDAIAQIPELKLVAVCDVNKNLAETVAKQKQVKAYTDYRQLIRDQEVDLVSVCALNGLHFAMGRECARQRKHCVMEKPIALTYGQAQKLVTAFKIAKVKLFPVLQVRFHPAVAAVKQALESKALGNLYSASLVVRWSRPQSYFSQSPWRGTKKLDGGSLTTQAIHYVDIAQYLLGPAKSVFGKLDTKAHRIETEDMANAIVDFKNKVRLNLEFTINTYPHNLECSLTILGEKGTIKIGGLAMNKIELWQVENLPPPELSEGLPSLLPAGLRPVGSSPYHYFVYEDVVKTLVHQQPQFLKAKDALESLRIIDGIRKSSQLQKQIEL